MVYTIHKAAVEWLLPHMPFFACTFVSILKPVAIGANVFSLRFLFVWFHTHSANYCSFHILCPVVLLALPCLLASTTSMYFYYFLSLSWNNNITHYGASKCCWLTLTDIRHCYYLAKHPDERRLNYAPRAILVMLMISSCFRHFLAVEKFHSKPKSIRIAARGFGFVVFCKSDYSLAEMGSVFCFFLLENGSFRGICTFKMTLPSLQSHTWLLFERSLPSVKQFDFRKKWCFW